jgi:hypothetical protein
MESFLNSITDSLHAAGLDIGADGNPVSSEINMLSH